MKWTGRKPFRFRQVENIKIYILLSRLKQVVFFSLKNALQFSAFYGLSYLFIENSVKMDYVIIMHGLLWEYINDMFCILLHRKIGTTH